MTLSRSFIKNAITTPLDARLMLMAQVVANADGSPRAGVLGSSNPSIVTALGMMEVAIAAAEFVTTKGRADGVSIFANDGTVNVAIGAAPVSNSRIDTIWVKHNDSTTGDANSLPTFGVTPGVAAPSPVKAAIPTGALELATLRVYAGTTAANGGTNTLTNTYAMTAARGGEVPFRTKDALNLWTTAAVGQSAVTLSTGEKWTWSGSSWVLVFRALLPWTPTITGLTIGNGLLRAFYSKRDKVIEVFLEFESGTTTAATGTVTITPPEPIADSSLYRHMGEGFFRFAGANSGAWPAQARQAGGATVNINLLDASGALIVPGSSVNNTFPTGGAWGNAAYLPTFYLHFSYRTAD